MSKDRGASQPKASRDGEGDREHGEQARAPRGLALSGPVRRTLVSFHERGQHRRLLLDVLILAQALLLVSAAPGYLGAQAGGLAEGAVALGLAACAGASVFNRWFGDSRRAAYLLVGGVSVAVVAQIGVAALAGNAVQASLASLLWLTVILEAGVLFAPEATLITAGTALALTVVALLFALSLGAAGSRREAYVLVVETLGLLSVTSLIAWLLAQFIYDSAVEAQRGQEQRFAQARYEALVLQTAEQHERLEAAVAALQQAIGRAIHGELTARANVTEGELSVLAASLNMLLEQLDALTQSEIIKQRMEAAALPLIDVVGRVAEGATPPASLPIITNTPLDTVSVAVKQMQANVSRRLARVQEISGEVVGALAHTQQGLGSTSQTAGEALRTVGAAIAAADGMHSAAQRELELIARMRRALAGALPDETSSSPGGEAPAVGLAASEAAALLGLGADVGVGAPGLTGSFGPLELTPPSLAGEAPAEAAEGEAGAGANGKRTRTGRAAGEAPPDLGEIGKALEQLQGEAMQQERGASALAHELGILNRNVRGVDAAVAWARQALEAVRRNAEKLTQLAGGSGPLPVPGEAGPSVPMRAPMTTRPLADEGRMAPGALLEGLDLSALLEGSGAFSGGPDARPSAGADGPVGGPGMEGARGPDDTAADEATG
jgi:methyl-accepting chemotaxis protein